MNWFIGLGPEALKYAIATGSVGALLVAAYFVPSLKAKAVLLCVVAAIVSGTWAYTNGVRDEHKRGLAQWNAQVDQEIGDAKKDRASGDADVDRAGDDGMRDDRFNRDRAGH